jgi:ribosomal-protein-alanine N-acetyltransferase
LKDQVKPLIETVRLRIIPFSESFLTLKYVGWLNDPEVIRYSEQRHYAHTLDTCRKYLESYAGTSNFFWAITEKNPDLGHIGNINAYVDTHNRIADVGIMIGEKRAWKRGYGVEAWIAVCSFLFDIERMRKITAGTISANQAMIGLMNSCGMVDDGKRVKHYLFEEEEVDIVHMAFFRDIWRCSVKINELKTLMNVGCIET